MKQTTASVAAMAFAIAAGMWSGSIIVGVATGVGVCGICGFLMHLHK